MTALWIVVSANALGLVILSAAVRRFHRRLGELRAAVTALASLSHQDND